MFSFLIKENFTYTQIVKNSSKIPEKIKMMEINIEVIVGSACLA